MDSREYDEKTLAYIGDAVYEVYIREYITKNSKAAVNKLHKLAIKYVSAKAQANIVQNIENNITEYEKQIIKRGRNKGANTVPKNTDIVTYKIATGYESLIGYLYIKKDIKRLEEIIDMSIKIIEKSFAEV